VGNGTLPAGGPVTGPGSGLGAAGHGSVRAGDSCSTGVSGLRGANQSLAAALSVPPPADPDVPASTPPVASACSVPAGGHGAGVCPAPVLVGAVAAGASAPCARTEPSVPSDTTSDTGLRTTTGGIGREPGMLIRIRVVSVVSVFGSSA
jgi:hypothetical protein